ncbi:hypothetical protein DFJ43DRAFT_1100085 [Lentinula guzmanii]|uniref:N-acetyltransferase domain-containing protein n=1 Tax=Lentinula guzmanii TaxID=2804957 RepID=A0AA38JHF6_9AGAR|nr:hypothetical protein DFJ43DRAFT_1100085 [Lentinula guzmanii]
MLRQSTSLDVAPFTVTKGTEAFMIREARLDELEAIGWVAAEAFINDTMAHYLSSATKPMSITSKADLRALYDLYYFLFKACMIGGGRAVVALPTESSSGETKIAAAACWYPPGKRIKVFNALRSGVLRCIRNWGFRGFMRVSEEYTSITHSVFERTFTAKAMGIPVSEVSKGRRNKRKTLLESDSWYLQLMFSSKQYEGRGLMSTLMREGFAYAHSVTPGIPITLDASSSRARDRYMHLGYELMEPQTMIGVQRVGSQGIAPSKNNLERIELTGVPYWCMVNWEPTKSLHWKEKDASEA